MPAYLIIQIKFTAPKERFTSYRDAVGLLAAAFGGRYLIAGGVKVDPLEGSHDGRSLVMLNFHPWMRSMSSGIRPAMRM